MDLFTYFQKSQGRRFRAGRAGRIIGYEGDHNETMLIETDGGKIVRAVANPFAQVGMRYIRVLTQDGEERVPF